MRPRPRWGRSRPSTWSCYAGGSSRRWRWPAQPRWWHPSPTWSKPRWPPGVRRTKHQRPRSRLRVVRPTKPSREETMLRGESKITSSQLGRVAIIYVRQSTLAQVRGNTESTARQYGLAAEAARLGWAASAIEVIDADLGISGRSAEGRAGFKELVARVCLGEVGAIFGLEVSRLARSSADLAKLLELARLTETLVVDTDGIYDLADFNDRILLGLKGQMSEAELHILAGRQACCRRPGGAALPAPRRLRLRRRGGHRDGPDEEVHAAVADVFAAFEATGSAYQVVGAFAERRFPKRAYG